MVLINSTVWDVNRWGPNGDIKFQSNIRKLMLLFQCNLPCDTAVVWVTALHPAAKIQGRALVVKQVGRFSVKLRFHSGSICRVAL